MGSQQTLYNGIELPDQWPPRRSRLSLEPKTPWYLSSPPKVISIDVGRQLFVDDFLIEQTTLTRRFHTAEYHPASPVLTSDKPWEEAGDFVPVSYREKGLRAMGCNAMPFSDGVWYDPNDKIFKMWYMSGLLYATAYATSSDGIHWDKPELDVVSGTNIVHAGNRDSSTVWLDLDTDDPQRRYVLYRFEKVPKRGFALHYSADGIHWTDEVRRAGECLDRATMFYNPFRKVWVFSLKSIGPVDGYDETIPWSEQGHGEAERIVRYYEQADLLDTPMWDKIGEPALWLHTDRRDPIYANSDVGQPKFYNVDAVAYESILLGAFSVLETYYPEVHDDRPKRNQVQLGFSRDGFYFDRPLRKPVVELCETKGAWNWGNMQSVGGICLVVGDQLYIYVSGRAGSGRLGSEKSDRDSDGSTGLAIMRRDGFASMEAGEEAGTLTTRPLRFSGKHLFVNTATADGELTVEVLDQSGQVIAPFSRSNCQPVRTDKTLHEVRWQTAGDLSAIASPARFRFHLRNGSLYAFWVSPDANGASYGYVAAGGPGFTGHTDTVGKEGYAAAAQATSG